MFITVEVTIEESMVVTVMDILDLQGTTVTAKDTCYFQRSDSISAISDHPLCSNSITTVVH
jgi:hypothetical protein